MNILLLKSSSQKSCKYSQLLESNGITVSSVDPLEVDLFVDSSLQDLVKIHNVLVFTSVKSVHALRYLCNNPQFISGKICYVVGPNTAVSLRELGFTDVRGEVCGSAEKLADFIRTDLAPCDLLFLCGNLAEESNLYHLGSQGYKIKSVVCYLTKQSPNLHDELTKTFKYNENLVTIIFSPSIARYFFDWCVAYFDDNVPVPVIAIGPTTAKCINGLGKPFSLRGVSDKPNPTSLLEVIKSSSTSWFLPMNVNFWNIDVVSVKISIQDARRAPEYFLPYNLGTNVENIVIQTTKRPKIVQSLP